MEEIISKLEDRNLEMTPEKEENVKAGKTKTSRRTTGLHYKIQHKNNCYTRRTREGQENTAYSKK